MIRLSVVQFFKFARKFLDALTHDLARLEFHGGARRDGKAAARLVRVATDSWFGQTRLKHSEIPQFDRNIIGQTVSDVIQRSLHNIKDLVLHHSGFVAYRHYDIAFG